MGIVIILIIVTAVLLSFSMMNTSKKWWIRLIAGVFGVILLFVTLSLPVLDPFAVINDSFICDEYKIIATKIGKESEALKKFIDIAKEYGQMGMNEKFNALAKIDTLNYHREKTK